MCQQQDHCYHWKSETRTANTADNGHNCAAVVDRAFVVHDFVARKNLRGREQITGIGWGHSCCQFLRASTSAPAALHTEAR
jgi:hypothetical protein